MFHIVDDDEDIRVILTEVIGLLGYESKMFACPKAYLEFADSPDFETPYALLSDVQMPKMNGYEMLDRVKEIHPEIRTAVISGFPKYEGEAKIHTCTFLSKPIEIDKFGHVLESFAKCAEDGPNAQEYGCGSSNDHEEFGLKHWQCPHGKRCSNC